MENPFVIQGYQGKEYFCDRQDEIKALENHIVNNRNITVYGWRRLGKTSLIQYLAEEIKEKHRIETLFVDISTCRNYDNLKSTFFQAVFHKFGKTKKGGIKKTFQKIIASLGVSLSFDPLTGLPSFSFQVQETEDKERSLSQLFHFLDQLDSEILIVFDEFQQVQNIEKGEIEASLRNFTQTFPELRFLFSGSHRGIMQSMFTSSNRPFYRSTQLLELRPIDSRIYAKFIYDHFKDNNKNISTDLINQIYQWSRGETYCIQLICNYLFSSSNSVVQQDFIETKESILQQFHGYFAELLNLLTDKQVAVLKSIAKNEPVQNPTSQNFIKSNNLGAASSVQSALKALQDKEIIFKENSCFFVHDVLLSKWLKIN